MTGKKVPFVLGVRFQTESLTQIEVRLAAFLVKFRSERFGLVEPLHALDHLDDDVDGTPHDGEAVLAFRDWQKIRKRAKRIVERRNQRSGMKHLREDEVALLQSRQSGVVLKGPGNVHAVDELASALTEEMPWMVSAIEPIWRDARTRVDEGLGFGFKPLLLVGPPGIGKTHLLRLAADLSDTPYVMLDASAAGDGFSIAGAQRTWGRASPGRPVSSILETGCGNPMIFVDEIDKAGFTLSTKGTTSSAWNALLGLLEPVSAARWTCPFYGVSFDMSHANWVLAANGTQNIPEPLLSRCRVVHLGPLSRSQLLELAAREIERRGLDPDLFQDVADVLDIVPDGHARLNIRIMQKIIDGVSDIHMRPQWH